MEHMEIDGDRDRDGEEVALTDRVLQWSVNDIFSPCPTFAVIPNSFTNSAHYAAVFRPMLYEELKSSCARSLELFANTSIQPGSISIFPDIQLFDMTFFKRSYTQKISKWKGKIKFEQQQYKHATTHILPKTLLCILPNDHQHLLEFQRQLKQCIANNNFTNLPSTHAFGIATNWNAPSNKDLQGYLEVELANQHYTNLASFSSSNSSNNDPPSYLLFSLDNLLTHSRADMALSEFAQQYRWPDCTQHILNGRQTVVEDMMESKAEVQAQQQMIEPIITAYGVSLQLNTSQIDALKRIAIMHIHSSQPIELICGPPGKHITHPILSC